MRVEENREVARSRETSLLMEGGVGRASKGDVESSWGWRPRSTKDAEERKDSSGGADMNTGTEAGKYGALRGKSRFEQEIVTF